MNVDLAFMKVLEDSPENCIVHSCKISSRDKLYSAIP